MNIYRSNSLDLQLLQVHPPKSRSYIFNQEAWNYFMLMEQVSEVVTIYYNIYDHHQY